MGTFSFGQSGTMSMGNDYRLAFPVQNSATGADNSTTSGELHVGDWVVLTNSSTYATSPINSVNVLSFRKATYRDIITNAINNGLLGLCTEDMVTDANGRITGNPQFGLTQPQVTKALVSPSARWQQNLASLRNRVPVILGVESNLFNGNIIPTYTAAAMGPNLDMTLGGIGLSIGLNPPTVLQGTTLSTATTGGTIPASTEYWFVFTFLNNIGQTVQSNIIHITTGSGTSTSTITVAASTSNSGLTSGQAGLTNIATAYLVYAGTSATGPFYLQNTATGTALGTTFTISAPISTTTANPPTANTTGLPGVTTYWVDPGASTQCFRIIRLNPDDLLYNKTQASGNTSPGCQCLVQLLSTYSQYTPSQGTVLTNYTN